MAWVIKALACVLVLLLAAGAMAAVSGGEGPRDALDARPEDPSLIFRGLQAAWDSLARPAGQALAERLARLGTT